MRAGLHTSQYLLPLVHPRLIQAYQAREANPQAVEPFRPKQWESANWRLGLERDAKKAFPKAEWIRGGPERVEHAVSDTKAALVNMGAPLIEGASFFANVSPVANKPFGFYARAFLLEPSAADPSHVSFYEVAAAAEPTQVEIMQMAMQYCIMRRSGLTVDKATFLTASAEQLVAKSGDKYATIVFERKDFTENVLVAVPEAERRLAEAETYLLANPPKTHADDPAIPATASVSALAPAKDKKWLKWWVVNRLTALGIIDLGQIPEDFRGLEPVQREQIRAHREGREFIRVDRAALRKVFAARKFPVHYLDFETRTEAGSNGARRDIPFQFSDHILDEDGALSHASHLAEGNEDPRLRFAECLAHAVGDVGTVVVYYKDFEASRIRETAEYLRSIGKDDLANRIETIIPRMQDQLEYLRDNVVHSGFQGSYKLKTTHPTLVKSPATTYDKLDIKNGEEATKAIEEICRPETSAERRAFLREALEEYCGLDTYAMVEIDHVLQAWANEAD